jgi:hypothetical protein
MLPKLLPLAAPARSTSIVLLPLRPVPQSVCRPPKRCSRPLKKKKVKNIEIFSKNIDKYFSD